jgi:hypothetical protein
MVIIYYQSLLSILFLMLGPPCARAHDFVGRAGALEMLYPPLVELGPECLLPVFADTDTS